MATETFAKLVPQKQSRIIQSAIEAFAQNGYSRTSMEVVAEKAGIAKGALYRYFSGKKDLYMLVVDNLFSDLDIYARQFLEQHRNHDAFEAIRDHLVSIYKLRERFAVHFRIICNILYQEQLDFKGEVLAKFGKLTTQYMRLILQRGIARGEIRDDIDLDAAAFVIDSVMDRFHDGVWIEFMDHGFGLYNQPQEVLNRKADQILQYFRQAIGKQSDRQNVDNVA